MNGLAQKEPQQIAAVDPMQLIANAIEKGVDIDQLTKLMDLQERWEAGNAKKSFVAAMAEFKKDPPKLVKDKKVSFGNTNYKHAELDQVTGLVAKALSAVNISHRFEISQNDKGITVTCVLTHVDGHSERTPLMAGADSTGGKNAIQAVGSTVSYLQRYTLLAATGLATGEGDDDGAGAGAGERISDTQYAHLNELIIASASDVKAFCKHFKINKLEDLAVKAYQDAEAMLVAKLNRGKK